MAENINGEIVETTTDGYEELAVNAVKIATPPASTNVVYEVGVLPLQLEFNLEGVIVAQDGADIILTFPDGGQITFVAMVDAAFGDTPPMLLLPGNQVLEIGDLVAYAGNIDDLADQLEDLQTAAGGEPVAGSNYAGGEYGAGSLGGFTQLGDLPPLPPATPYQGPALPPPDANEGVFFIQEIENIAAVPGFSILNAEDAHVVEDNFLAIMNGVNTNDRGANQDNDDLLELTISDVPAQATFWIAVPSESEGSFSSEGEGGIPRHPSAGIPDGFDFVQVGTNNEDGTWTFTDEELALVSAETPLFILPAGDTNVDFTLHFSMVAIDNDANPSVSAPIETDLLIVVHSAVDGATLSLKGKVWIYNDPNTDDILVGNDEVNTIYGGGGKDIIAGLGSDDELWGDTFEGYREVALKINPGLIDQDGSEALELQITGVPGTAYLSEGATDLGDGVWSVPVSMLGNLSIFVFVDSDFAAHSGPELTLGVRVRSVDIDLDLTAGDVGETPDGLGHDNPGYEDVSGWTYGQIKIDIRENTQGASDLIAGGEGDDSIYGQIDDDLLIGDGHIEFYGIDDVRMYATAVHDATRNGDGEGAYQTPGIVSEQRAGNGQNGYGVVGTSESGVNKQIGNDWNDGDVSEELVFELGADASLATVTISNLYMNEGGRGAHETGKWTAYDSNGVEVGSDTFIARDLENGNGSHHGDFTINLGGQTFSKIVFSAEPYTTDGVTRAQSNKNDSSDYFVTNIHYEVRGEPVTPGSDYIEGGVGNDVIYGDNMLNQNSDVALGRNLIVNGDFEDFKVRSGGWGLFASGTADWTADNGITPDQREDGLIEIQNGPHGGTATGNNTNFSELDSHNAGSNTTIYQTITVAKDGSYELSFDYAGRDRGGRPAEVTSGFNVVVNNTVVATYAPGNDSWLNETLTLSLGAGDNTIGFQATMYQDTYGALIDNVSLREHLADDVLYGNSGNDIINGEIGADWIVGGTDDGSVHFNHGFTVTFEGSYAGYNNSFGYYVMDAEGNPTVGKIIWHNLNATAQEVSYDINLDGIDRSDIGFFLIPNGDRLNSGLTDDMPVQFKDDNGQWSAYLDDGVTVLTGKNANAYFSSSADLNKDGFDHVNENLDNGDNDPTTPNTGFEDLYNGGDKDFNDAIFNVEPKTFVQEFEGGDHLWGNSNLAEGEGDGAKDIFYFEQGDGVDTIHDFELGKDQLVINGYTEDDMNIFQSGADTIIELGGGSEAIKLVGINANIFNGGAMIEAFDADTGAGNPAEAGNGALSADELIEMQNDLFADETGPAPSSTQAHIVIITPQENYEVVDDNTPV